MFAACPRSLPCPQIFGKTLVCRNLDVARHVALESNLNCITMDGDKVDKKGGMGIGRKREGRGKGGGGGCDAVV